MKKLTKFLVLSSLILLSTGQMWAWALKANCVYLDNYGANWTPWIHIYTGSEDQYYALKKVDGTDYYVREYDYGSYAGFDLYNASNTGQRTSWQIESFESPICFSLSGSSWIKKAVGVKDVKLSDNGSTTYGGNGTSSTPYLIWPGEDIKAIMSCTKIASTNHTRQYQFESNSFSTTDTYQKTTSTTSGTSYEIYGKARAVLTSNTSTTSREFSATSLYYKTATFYLMQPNGQDKGSSVGTMTRDGSGNYTYNWTCSTPGTYKFYVTTNTSSSAHENCDFLNSNSSFSDGTPIQLYLYGNTSDAANKYGDAITLTTTYAGTYTFTFYKSNDKYYFKCDYPAAYSSLSAVRTPEAAADAPQISNTIVAQGSSVTVTAKTPKTGYKFDNWTSSNGTFGTATDLSTTFTPNANNAVATANYSLINYSITYDPVTPINFEYTTKPTSATYNTNVAMAFTPATNYVIASVNVYKTGDEGTTVEVTRNGETNNYSFTQPAYNVTVKVEVSLSQVQVTYGKVGEGTIVAKVEGTDIGASPASVDGGATVVFTATPDANYTVEGWYANSTCTGDKLQNGDNTGVVQTYTINNIAEAQTVYVKFKETKYAVNIQTSTGIQSVTPSGEQPVGNVTPVNISAEVATGYTWSQWTASSVNVTITDATLASTTIKATGEGTVTATATEILLPLTTSVTESYMGTVEKTKAEIGVATTSTLTASSANHNYKFKQWNLTNCTITSGTINDATITIKGDGINTPSAEAEFEVAWYVNGDGVFSGWGTDGHQMTEQSEGVFAVTINVTQIASQSTDFGCKIYNASQGWYYEYNNTEGDGFWFTRENPSTTIGHNNKTNMRLRSDMVGDYTFTLDCSTSRENPTLTVTFPTSTTYDVDIYYDGVTKTTVEGGSFTKQITAQVPESMQFDHWEVEGETTHVSITNAQSQTTTFTASGTGAIIRAKFNTNKRIYLKGGSNFSDAYINFYKGAYWNSDLGSGNTGSECVQRNQHMTKIQNTDIFWYDLNNASNQRSNYFTFVNKSGDYNNFYMCNVVYRNDMKDALPFYVPRNSYANEHHNSSQYFNEGIWMKYNNTYSGYRLWIKNTVTSVVQDENYFNAEIPGGYEFQTKVSLAAGATYEFKIYNENGTWYGATDQTMTATSCTNWKMHLNNDNCKITASEAGNYTFILNLGSGEVIVSVEYPLSASDYRVVAKKDSEDKWVGDLIKHSDVAKNDTTSFFNNNYTYQLQQYDNEGNWSDVTGQTVIPPDSAKQGVINFIVTQDGNGSATLAYEGIYTGNYYIRTDGVDGGWGDYENNSDNKMDNYGSSIQADPEYQYDVYKAKWITSGKNVKFRVANDYSKAISDELKGDAVIGNDKETLPQSANVRFMWNSTTNQLKRAYLSGSSNASDRYLILEGDDKMFDENGDALTTEGGGKIEGLDDNELNFKDMNNWVYQADIQAQPGCEVKLTAKYNGIVQYFIGKEDDGDDSRRKIIDGSGTDKYNLRAVYDFKTNRLVVGWMPGDTIKSSIELGSDMLIERTGQGDASQIVFGGESAANLSISKIQHIYGVLKLTKESMLAATATTYGKCIYWISFPFDVKVSEIFGVEKYGEVWVISNYRGDLRAQKGWFKEDTPTFWEYLKPTDIMKANVGYTLNLDPDYFNKETSEPWKSGAEEVAWYFPSMQANIGVVSLAQKDTTLLPQHCEIDREFNAGTEESPRMVNHKFTDSNWRVIGVPAFQNLQAPTFDPAPVTNPDDEGKKNFGLTGFYEWQPSTNTYTVRITDGYTFKATGAYMVQYEGKITWSNASAITTKNSAPWHASADSKSYSIKLEFGNEAYTDQTFVTLTEKASTDFVLNEDMMKIDNAGFPNIYSFAGAYNVAYNETKMDNQTVTLGVSAPKAGTYTFAMPNQFSGTAKLVDLVEGITTDLNVSNYSVDLSKGTYNDRFQLLLEVEAKAPTSMENVDGGKWNVDGKTLKLLRNGNIYLINAGRVYNATGAELR
ncbi:MAG: hypothetical protein MJZ84_06950 [Paludibacteraceae bacterium]|nr:hypothetical protein [Paludibacteraceae bacterium]